MLDEEEQEGREIRLLFFDQPPAFFLDAAFCGVNDEELTALLELGVPRDIHPAFIVIGGEF